MQTLLFLDGQLRFPQPGSSSFWKVLCQGKFISPSSCAPLARGAKKPSGFCYSCVTFCKYNGLVTARGGECSISSTLVGVKFENAAMTHKEKEKAVHEMLGKNLGNCLVWPMWFIAVGSVGSWWKPDVRIQLFRNVSCTIAWEGGMRGEQAQQTSPVDKARSCPPRFSLQASWIWDSQGLSTYYLTKDTSCPC